MRKEIGVIGTQVGGRLSFTVDKEKLAKDPVKTLEELLEKVHNRKVKLL